MTDLAKEHTMDRYDYAQYLAEMEARAEKECGATLEFGPANDPYGSTCELDRRHDGPHEGPGMGLEDTIRWKGGGRCAGDRLPATIVTGR